MVSIEDTPLGLMAITWGTRTPGKDLADLGIDDSTYTDAEPSSYTCREPIYGEEKTLGLYLDANGKPFALGEITYGIYAIGAIWEK